MGRRQLNTSQSAVPGAEPPPQGGAMLRPSFDVDFQNNEFLIFEATIMFSVKKCLGCLLRSRRLDHYCKSYVGLNFLQFVFIKLQLIKTFGWQTERSDRDQASHTNFLRVWLLGAIFYVKSVLSYFWFVKTCFVMKNMKLKATNLKYWVAIWKN